MVFVGVVVVVCHEPFVDAEDTAGFQDADSMALAADCLVAGAKEDLFTPMYLMVARKPKA